MTTKQKSEEKAFLEQDNLSLPLLGTAELEELRALDGNLE
jgi:hypothetical protein